MSRKEGDVRWRGRSSCMLKCMRIISRSSGVRRTVEAAERLRGVGLAASFWTFGISSSVLDERRQSADFMRLKINIRLATQQRRIYRTYHMVFRIL